MFTKNPFKTVLTVSALSLVIGCSNSNSPVSVESDVSSTSARLDDIEVQEVARGADKVWGLQYSETVGVNYQIYVYLPTYDQWYPTSHYGTRISASVSGRCYHINAENQIWWGTLNSNGQIPNPPVQIKYFDDITAGRVGNSNGQGYYDVVWVTLTDVNYQNQIWKYCKDASQNFVWINVSPSNLSVSGGISAASNNGNNVAALLGSPIRVYKYNGSQWILDPNSPSDCYDVSVHGDVIVCSNNAHPGRRGGAEYDINIGIGGGYYFISKYLSSTHRVCAFSSGFYNMYARRASYITYSQAK